MKIRLSTIGCSRWCMLSPARNYFTRKLSKHGYKCGIAPTREWSRHNRARFMSPAEKILLSKIQRMGGAF